MRTSIGSERRVCLHAANARAHAGPCAGLTMRGKPQIEDSYKVSNVTKIEHLKMRRVAAERKDGPPDAACGGI
jgi:hypothetical protein